MMDDALRYLFHGYFGDLWPELAASFTGDERGTWRGAILRFMSEEPDPRWAVVMLGELSVIIESPLSEGERLYEQWDVNYWPFPSQTMQEWLADLRDELALQLIAHGRVAADPLASVQSTLAAHGMRPPDDGAGGEPREWAATVGSLAPLEDVFELLSELSLALAPSVQVDDEQRSWLQAIRTAAARGAVSRWEPTASSS